MSNESCFENRKEIKLDTCSEINKNTIKLQHVKFNDHLSTRTQSNYNTSSLMISYQQEHNQTTTRQV